MTCGDEWCVSALAMRMQCACTAQEYEELKAQRCECLYRGIEEFIPDIRERVTQSLIGSPLTHARFLQRHR